MFQTTVILGTSPIPCAKNFKMMMHELRAFQMVVGPTKWKATSHQFKGIEIL
jgi:hypothetical protein